MIGERYLNTKLRFLLLSPVGSSSAVLRPFLSSLESLHAPGRLQFAFIDDTPDAESREMLQTFAAIHGAVLFPPPSPRPATPPHVWPERSIWLLAAMRDCLLAHARASGVDAALMVDADQVLSPRTLVGLWACRVDIVSEVLDALSARCSRASQRLAPWPIRAGRRATGRAHPPRRTRASGTILAGAGSHAGPAGGGRAGWLYADLRGCPGGRRELRGDHDAGFCGRRSTLLCANAGTGLSAIRTHRQPAATPVSTSGS